MAYKGPDRRKQQVADSFAARSAVERTEIDNLDHRATDTDEEVAVLRADGKKALLGLAGSTTEQTGAELPPEAVEAKAPTAELSTEQAWLGQFKTRFDALPQLHKGVQWADVEKSLKADPESMRKLQALDEKGHNMNVFGEENGEYVFASGWSDYNKISADHRNIAYDTEGQKLAEKQGYSPNSNAVSIIAKIMGVEEDEATNYLADPKFHEQLREAIAVNGWAWLKTDTATRETGYAFNGYSYGIRRYSARSHADAGSFRAALRVKKA